MRVAASADADSDGFGTEEALNAGRGEGVLRTRGRRRMYSEASRRDCGAIGSSRESTLRYSQWLMLD